MKPLRSSYPATHLLNPAFRYTPAAATDIRETIRRARLREQRREYVAKPERNPVGEYWAQYGLRVD